jgi:hypothetical protein
MEKLTEQEKKIDVVINILPRKHLQMGRCGEEGIESLSLTSPQFHCCLKGQ